MMKLNRTVELFSGPSAYKFLIYCLVPALIVYGVCLIVLTQSGFSLIEILRDPAQQTKHSSFLGFVSSIGVWLWVAASAVTAFRLTGTITPEVKEQRTFLRTLAIVSFILAFDDFFLIHDRFIAEGILIPIYAATVLYILKKYFELIVKIDGFAFFQAGAFLACSVLVDAVQEILPIGYGASQAVEEGFKFLGAAAWLYFCARAAAYQLVNQGEAPENPS